MTFKYSFFLTFISLTIMACKTTIIPRHKKSWTRGYYYQYDKLNFNNISKFEDTTWHSQIKPLADLLIDNPHWTVKLKTFLADSSIVEFDKREDVIVANKISKYLIRQGVNQKKIIAMAYNNVDDRNRIVYQGPIPKSKYKRQKFSKDTVEWEIVKITD